MHLCVTADGSWRVVEGKCRGGSVFETGNRKIIVSLHKTIHPFEIMKGKDDISWTHSIDILFGCAVAVNELAEKLK